MRKLIYLLACIAGTLLFMLSANAQLSHELDWAKQIQPNGGKMPRDLVTDISGNIISTGNFTLSFDFEPVPAPFYLKSQTCYEREIFVQKPDPEGDLMWVRQFGANTGELEDMATIR
jgi:hypothetical protein